jgi:hypothetical protein
MGRRGSKLGVLLVIIILFVFILNRRNRRHESASGSFDRSNTSLVFTKHARCRMECRHIDETEVKEILQSGTINYGKSEPAGRPDPKYALEGITHDHQHVRIVFAPSNGKMVVITVIDLDGEWKCNC